MPTKSHNTLHYRIATPSRIKFIIPGFLKMVVPKDEELCLTKIDKEEVQCMWHVLTALKNMLSSDARVLRNGEEFMISAADLVPGDVVILDLGESIPADIRLVRVSNLASSEAALTGESLPIEKKTDPVVVPSGVLPMQIPLGDRHNML